MLRISDEGIEEILNWGSGPEPAITTPNLEEQWEKFVKRMSKPASPTLFGKKSDKTSKCKYCGGTAYWMETAKGYRLVDFFNRAHMCENYKLGKVQ